jgi:hypothetical protein
MAGLVPAIHVFLSNGAKKTWMPGTRPGMTKTNREPLSAYFPARGGGRSFIEAFSFAIVALKYSSRSLLKRC